MDALRRLGVDVCGVLAREAKAARRRHSRVYADLSQVLADQSVDVVHVATPNDLHAQQVTQIVAAGKQVVCEKPLALTSADGRAMLAAAETAGVVHAVCFNLRFNPLVHHLRDLVAAGALGNVHLITGSYQQDWLLTEEDWNWRIDPERSGPLRAAVDIGSHWIDLASFVTGAQVESLCADLTTVHPTRSRPLGSVATFGAVAGGQRESVTVTTDDMAGLLLRFEGGARGTATVSQVSAGRKNSCRIEFYGDAGAAAWDSELPDELWLGHKGSPNQTLLRDPSLLTESARRITRHPGGHAEGFAETFLGLFECVYAAVGRSGGTASGDGLEKCRPQYPTFLDGVQSLLIGDAIIDSASSHGWVDVPRLVAETTTSASGSLNAHFTTGRSTS